MHETGTLFEDDLLLEQDGRASLAIPTLPGTIIGGVCEAERSLGIESLSGQERAVRGFFAVLRSLGDGRKQQKIFHLGLLREVVSAIESTRTADIYLGNATYASARSRRVTNVRALQVAWVDVDCYNQGLTPTPELVDRLVERARFAGVPAPTHIICSGRGLYLKWLLDAPVRDSGLRAWGSLQAGLSALYRDVGADFAAIDQARVLRLVGSINSKVAQNNRRADPAMVGVVWDCGRRYTFTELCLAVSQLDVGHAPQQNASRAKAFHQVGAERAGNFLLPPELRGNLQVLHHYGIERNPNLDLELKAKAEGKSGMSAATLNWCRFLDLRDLFLRRAEASGATGIEEGARDLAMLWMVNFLAHARMVRSSNVFQEVEELLPAFSGVGLDGPRGFESPRTSGSLSTLICKMKASEAGKRVRFGGQLFDTKYTPSNDYLINLFRISSDEMKGMRTIIDSGEKQCRADSKVPGRSERRQARQSWNEKALQMRAENAQAADAGEASIPPRKLVSHIAQAVGVDPKQLRQFFTRHDASAALKEQRKLEGTPARKSRMVPAPFGDQATEHLHAQPNSSLNELNQQTVIRVAHAAQAEEEALLKGSDAYKEVMARFARRIADAPERPADSVLKDPPGDQLPATAVGKDPAAQGSLEVTREIIRRMICMRDNLSSKGATMPPASSTAEPLSSPTGGAVAVVAAPPKPSKRDLLNRARIAVSKTPAATPPSVPGETSAGPAPAAPTPQVTHQAGSEPIATNVIPADIGEAWGGFALEEGIPAGMPDLDDGYLDSLDPGRDSMSRSHKDSASTFPAPEVHAAAAPAPVLGFGRPREGRAVGQVPSSPTGLSAKAPAPAAPQGSAPLAFKPAAAGAGTGFGLSPLQARAHGQALDFAKLFNDPTYDAQGVQVGYPTRDAWPQDDVAAGSWFPSAEWAQARQPDRELPHGHIVIELQVGNPITSALFKIPRVATAAPQHAAPQVVNGKVVKKEAWQGLDDAMNDALADTIVVSRKSPVDDAWRGAVEGGIEILRGGVSSYFRIIRPRAHYTDPDKFIFINAKLQLRGSLGQKGARAVPLEAGHVQEVEEDADGVAAEGVPHA
ncbi:MAG: hypothetical protein JSS14_22495 [Proteobacteria bacterium]|nr:hypothetical protein [Pseudomonadota bacterium]